MKYLKTVETLLAARMVLLSGQEKYICHAINQTGSTEAEKLSKWVAHLLGEHYSYESWMHSHYPRLIKYSADNNIQHLQAERARLAWINWMIKYWKRKK